MQNLHLPGTAIIKGSLPSGQTAAELVSDMLEIDLPDGTTIDVGWVPEHDPRGGYRIVRFKDYWENAVAEPVYTRSLRTVVATIRIMALEAQKQERGR